MAALYIGSYDIVDPGLWTVRPGKDRVEFIHELTNEAGYAYRYRKLVRLEAIHDEALVTLRKGPKTYLHTLTPAERAQWDAFGVELGPKVRGHLVPAQIYDEVQQLLREFRTTRTASK